jgi:hypothetical protein
VPWGMGARNPCVAGRLPLSITRHLLQPRRRRALGMLHRHRHPLHLAHALAAAARKLQFLERPGAPWLPRGVPRPCPRTWATEPLSEPISSAMAACAAGRGHASPSAASGARRMRLRRARWAPPARPARPRGGPPAPPRAPPAGPRASASPPRPAASPAPGALRRGPRSTALRGARAAAPLPWGMAVRHAWQSVAAAARTASSRPPSSTSCSAARSPSAARARSACQAIAVRGQGRGRAVTSLAIVLVSDVSGSARRTSATSRARPSASRRDAPSSSLSVAPAASAAPRAAGRPRRHPPRPLSAPCSRRGGAGSGRARKEPLARAPAGLLLRQRRLELGLRPLQVADKLLLLRQHLSQTRVTVGRLWHWALSIIRRAASVAAARWPSAASAAAAAAASAARCCSRRPLQPATCRWIFCW